MVSPRYKYTVLHVLAVDGADCREIDEKGAPLADLRLIGKTNREVLPQGAILPYHPHYISLLKEGSLLPLNHDTAKLAGVPFDINFGAT